MKGASPVDSVNMENPECWNCGENCLGEPSPAEDQTHVPIHFFVETNQVCRDCYQILLELDGGR
jgi:hypothetical protein